MPRESRRCAGGVGAVFGVEGLGFGRGGGGGARSLFGSRGGLSI